MGEFALDRREVDNAADRTALRRRHAGLLAGLVAGVRQVDRALVGDPHQLRDVAFAALVDVGRRRVDQDHGLAVGVMAGDDTSDYLIHFTFTPVEFVAASFWARRPLSMSLGARHSCDSMTSRRYFRLGCESLLSAATTVLEEPMRRVPFVVMLALLLAPLIGATPASAQAWPTRTVKFILTLGPGSGTDISGRLLADRLTRKWGQPVVIENRPGGDGVVAINAFVSAKDDHILLLSPTSSFIAHPWTHENRPYKPEDLAPIARVSNTVIGIKIGRASCRERV